LKLKSKVVEEQGSYELTIQITIWPKCRGYGPWTLWVPDEAQIQMLQAKEFIMMAAEIVL